MSTIIDMDKCVYYVNNFDINEFVFNFFGKEEVFSYDHSIKKKIKLLQTDFINFWLSLDDINKVKFIKVVNDYEINKDKQYKVKFY